jgi:SAM-dependent methyltransferase
VGVYTGLRDCVFNVAGSFAFMRCPHCGLLWLNPRPIVEDIPKCYEEYLTHATVSQNDVGTPKRKFAAIREFLRTTVLCGYYGYRHIHRKHTWCFSGPLIAALPAMKSRATHDMGERFPHYSTDPEALFLDVGCGQGWMLSRMKELGWKVFGVETDPVAAEIAKQRGLPVHVGSLESACLPAASADHIILSHVIEHLPDPLGTIKECLRILKPGGKLVVYTPNAGSLGLKIFGRNLYSIDTPRHFFMFSSGALSALMRQGGFNKIRSKTSPVYARKVYSNSRRLAKHGRLDTSVFAHQRGSILFGSVEVLLCAAGIPLGEEIVMTALKE